MQFEGRIVVDDLVELEALSDRLHHLAEGVEQIPDLDVFEVDFGLVVAFDLRRAAGMSQRLLVGGLAEVDGCVLERLVLQQLAHQFRSRVEAQALLLAFLLRRGRQEHTRLDFHQRRGHHHELARNIRVELGEHLDVGDVLLGDPGDGDVVDVHLVPADQVQQQIERPVVDVQVDAVVGGHVIQRVAGRRRDYNPYGGRYGSRNVSAGP